jgi:hypothetical protein
MLAEAEEGRAAATTAAAEATQKLAREAAETRQLRLALEGSRAAAGAAGRQLAEARRLLDSVTRELGLVGSRAHRAALERDGARQANAQLGAALAAARAELAEARARGLGDRSEQQQPPAAGEGEEEQQGEEGREAAGAGGGHGVLSAADARVSACPHGGLDSSCLLCACQRFLGAGAAPLAAAVGQQPVAPSLASDGAGTAAPPPPSGDAAAAASAAAATAAARQQLAAATEEAAAAQAGWQAAAAELARMRGEPAALAACGLVELRALEGWLEEAGRRLRTRVVEASVAEAAGLGEGALCTLCMEAPRACVFNCGHQVCAGCGDQRFTTCPFCRADITQRIRLFAS